jgi:hypothetical protein
MRRNAQRKSEKKENAAAVASAGDATIATATNPNQSSLPRIPAHVMLKLVLFSLIMIIGPISTYFISLWYFFGGNTTYSAIAAVALTNIIMFVFVIVAYFDDVEDGKEKGE